MHADANGNATIGSRKGNGVTVGKWKSHNFYSWRASYIEAGKRKQKGFKTRKAADKWAEDHEADTLKHGTAASLTKVERSAVLETRATLTELGLTIREALDYAIDYRRRSQKSATVATLIAEVIDARRKAGRSDRYLEDLENRLGRFRDDFGERIVATITRDEIADWLHALKLSPVTVNNYRRILVVAFNDAIESKYAIENPADKVKQVKEIEAAVEILTPAETKSLLNKADERILPVIALGAFAGLRSSELKRIDWADIDLAADLIRIRAVSAKSSRKRLIPICKALSAWLTPLAKKQGRVWPVNGRRLLDAAKRKAGFGNPESLTDKEKERKKTLKPWPDNGLRHSFASNHLAHHKNAGDLALQMGHTDTKIIFRHYRELVTPKAAANYWAILPKKVDNVISISA